MTTFTFIFYTLHAPHSTLNDMYIYKKRSLIILFTILDAIGGVVSWPFRVFGSVRIPENPERIAVLRLDHIGDIIMATVVLKPLRKRLPASTIDMIVPSWGFDLVKTSTEATNVVIFDTAWFDRRCSAGTAAQAKGVFSLARLLRKGKYDVVVDLRGDFRHILAMWLAGIRGRISYGVTGGGFLLTHEVPYRRNRHETERNIDLVRVLGAGPQVPEVEMHILPEAERKAERLLAENGVNGPYAVIHPSPGHSSKVWDEDGFFAVAGYLAGSKNLTCVFVGSPGGSGLVRSVVSRIGKKGRDLCGKTDLETLAALIRNASFFIGVDSAPAHIAAAFKVPGIILFSGINDPDEWAPKGGHLKVIHPGRGKDLSSVTPREVCEAIDAILG